jgi:isoquinoline 1-oxidoreductase beta subunit
MSPNHLDRRGFLKVTGAGASGLMLGFYVPQRFGPVTVHAAGPFAPNALLRILPDDTITILVGKSEMGQGVYTSLPMIATGAESRSNPPLRARTTTTR